MLAARFTQSDELTRTAGEFGAQCASFSAWENSNFLFYPACNLPIEENFSSYNEHPTALSAAVHPLARGNGTEKHRLPARTTATAIRLYPNGGSEHIK